MKKFLLKNQSLPQIVSKVSKDKNSLLSALHALKGQKLLAQGNTLGYSMITPNAL